MAILFTSLVQRLQLAVPARGGVPGAEQYEQAIRDAVDDFNNAATRLKVSTLQILPNTALYALPADCVKFVSLESLWLAESGGVLVTGSGLVPLDVNFNEIVTVEGSQLRITPTPTYSMARKLWYGAGHVDSGSPATYAEMTDREARIILLLAQSMALGLQANAQAGGITSYQIGDEKVDRSKVVQDIQGRSDNLKEQYDAAVEKYVGTLTQT